MSKPALKIAAFVSGGGSNMEAILDSLDEVPARIVVCIGSREGLGAYDRAARYGVPSRVLDPARFESDEAFTMELLDTLEAHEVNFIVLAGYLKRIPSEVVRRYRGRMLNIHPALLPAFGGHGMYGRRVHQAVIEHGVRWTGVTVHLVDEEYDTGPIVLQEPVPVHPDDTPETLAARVLETEHRLYPQAVRLFAEGRVRVDGRTVRILDASST